MHDHRLFLQMLSDFTRTLLTPYDVDTVFEELIASLVDVLGLAGSGVALARDGRLQLVTAMPDAMEALERVQHDHQAGPCVAAYQTGQVVTVSNLADREEEWPDYCRVAADMGLTSVAGIPMRLTDHGVGALNLYAHGPSDWSAEDVAAAVVMADMATGYLINASTLRQQEQLNEHLQSALDSRLVIEQAKGAVAHTHGIDTEAAFERIRQHARSHQVTVRAVAEAIVGLGLRI